MSLVSIPSSAQGRQGVATVRAMLAGRDDARTSVAARRAAMDAFAAAAPAVESVRVTEETLGGVAALKVEPRDARGAVLFLHGGAYVLGSRRTHAGLAARYALASGACFHVIDYRLAPEYPYPAALDDAVSAWTALVLDGPAAIVGDSAGGGLALATAVALRDRQMSPPLALAMASPWVDLTLSGTSMVERAGEEVMLSRAGLALDADRYRGTVSAPDSRVSPLFADLAGLPPTLLQVGTAEVLLDDAVRLHSRLSDVAVPCLLESWQDMAHAWPAFGAAVPEAQLSIDRLGDWLRLQLGG